MWWRWLRVVALAVLALALLLPALPPLQQWAIERVLEAGRFRGEWKGLEGYLLNNFSAQGIQLQGDGISLEADRLRVSYNLWALLGGEFPLELRVEGGKLRLDWQALVGGQGPAASGPRLRLDQLVLNNVEVELPEDRKLFLPNVRLRLRSEGGEYLIQAQLPGGSAQARARQIGNAIDAWELQTTAQVKALAYWFDGFEGGTLQGTVRVQNGQLSASQRIQNGVANVVGFRLSNISGSIELAQDILQAELRGSALGGPAKGSATVNLQRQWYRFSVSGLPTLPALAQMYGLNLPIEGQGRLSLNGQGWDKIQIKGQFAGNGLIVGEKAAFEGSLGFSEKFSLKAKVSGRFFDRTYQANFNLLEQNYQVALSDNLGSRLQLQGQGSSTSANGQLTLPQPLQASAALRFSSQGDRWQALVTAPKVGLLGTQPFALSGSLSGQGEQVNGRLGPLRVGGRWSDLALQLSPLPLVIGEAQGRGRLLNGVFSANLDYSSPYTNFPVRVWQEGRVFRLANPFGQGRYDGVFALRQTGVPLRLGAETYRLGGNLTYDGTLGGNWTLKGGVIAASGDITGFDTSVLGQATLGSEVFALRGQLNFAQRLQGNWTLSNRYVQGQGRWQDFGTSVQAVASLGSERFDLKGKLDFAGGISGNWTLQNRFVQAQGDIKGLDTVLKGKVTAGSETFALSGNLNYTNALGGQLKLSNRWLQASGTLEGFGGPIAGILSFGQEQFNLSGRLDFASGLRGNWQLQHPLVQAKGQIEDLGTTLQGVAQLGQERFDLQGALRFANGLQGSWQIDNRLLKASGQVQDTQTTFSGQASLGDQTLDLGGQVGFSPQLAGSYWLSHPMGQIKGQLNGLNTDLQGQLRVLGENLDLSAQLNLAQLSGSYAVSNRYLQAQGQVNGLSASLRGQATTPVGNFPLWGQASPQEVILASDRFEARYSANGWQLQGPLMVGPVLLEANLAYAQEFSGQLNLSSPWLQGQIVGQGPELLAQLSGYVQLSGPLWPQPKLAGQLTLPELGGLKVAQLPLMLDGQQLRLGDGRIGLGGDWPIDVRLPLAYQNFSGALQAQGNLQNLEASLSLPWGRLQANGPLQELRLSGDLSYAGAEASLTGVANALAQSYELAVQIPQWQASGQVQGQGLGVRFSAQAQEQRLRLQGTYNQDLQLAVALQGFSLNDFGLPARLSGTWSEQGGQLDLQSEYGQVQAQASELLGPLALVLNSPYGQAQGQASINGLDLKGVLAVPYLEGTVQLNGPWSALQMQGEGRYRLPALEQAPWQLQANLSNLTWGLSGPLELQGKGLEYSGGLNWAYALAGQSGLISGQVSGEGLRPRLSAQTVLEGLPLRLEARLQEPSLTALQAELSWPQGVARWENNGVRFAFEASPIAQIWQAQVSGKSQGWIALDGSGEASASLQAWGQDLSLRYQNQRLNAWLPQWQAGASIGWSEAQMLGRLEGHLDWQTGLQGNLSYQQGNVAAFAELSGPLLGPNVRLEARWPQVLEAVFEGQVALQNLQADGQLQVQSPYATLQARLQSQGSQYSLQGRLRSLQYLLQEGEFGLWGEGLNWRTAWSAPMGLLAQGQALSLQSASLSGQGQLLGYPLQGHLDFQDGAFAGDLKSQGEGYRLLLRGEGSNLSLSGDVYGAQINLLADGQGRLSGGAFYRAELASNRLEMQAQASGSLGAPKLLATGQLQGQGSSIALQGGFDGGLWATAQGPGVQARLQNDRLSIAIDTNLEPYVGTSLRLQSQAEGAWQTLEIPLQVSQGLLQASGQARLSPLQATLQGQYASQRFRVGYRQGLELSLLGPYLSGEVAFEGLEPSGVVGVRLELPGGGLDGELDLAERRLDLRGLQDWQGTLSAWLPKTPIAQVLQNPLQIEPNLVANVGLPVSWKGSYTLDLPKLELQGSGRVQAGDYGQLLVRAQGQNLAVLGTDGLEPLSASASLWPLAIEWRYKGDLPSNLGRLEAQGRYPGRWLDGSYTLQGYSVNLVAQDQTVQVSGPNLSGELGFGGPNLGVELNLAGVAVQGNLGGTWQDLQANLNWQALGRRGQAQVAYSGGGLRATLSGDLQGQVQRQPSWSGRLGLAEGSFELSGTDWIPNLDGQLLQVPLRLRYPEVQSGNLRLNLQTRQASGSTQALGVSLQGDGPTVGLRYPTPLGLLQGRLQLDDTVLRVGADFAKGQLLYRGGALEGQASLNLYGLEVLLQGQGDHLALQGSHPETPYLPWGAAELSGRLGLDGQWSLSYQDSQQKQRLQAQGRWLEANLKAQGAYLQGTLAYAQQLQGRLDLEAALPWFNGLLQGQVEAVSGGLQAKAQIQGDLGDIAVSASLGAEGPLLSASLQEVELQNLPWWRGRLDYLRGRVSGNLDYREGTWQALVTSPGVGVERDALPLELALAYRNGDFGGVFRLGDSQAVLGLAQGNLVAQARVSSFPLHWLLSAWAGPLEGEAYWTGRATFRYNLANPWDSQGIAVGERLRFKGAGDELLGQAVLRLERERLYVDQLKLSGRGSWNASGYLGRSGSDFQIELNDTVFTPVLSIIPALRPYDPEGGGTLRLSLKQENLSASFENFRFRLGPVAGEIPQGQVEVGERTSASGNLTLSAPYPAQANLTASGSLQAFQVKAKGSARVPLLEGDQPLDIEFGFPGYTLKATAADASVSGVVFPLRLDLNGELPVSYPQYYLQEGRIRVNRARLVQEGSLYRLSGDVDILRARLALPQGQQEVSVPLGRPSNPFPLVFDNVVFRAERGILFQESFAQGELFGEVTLGGTLTDPFLAGEVRALRGEVKLNDTISFTLRDSANLSNGSEERTVQSRVRFSPISGILPEVEAVGETLVRDGREGGAAYNVFLHAKGRFVRQNERARFVFDETYPRFSASSSNPAALPLSTGQVLALLTLGRSDLQAIPESLTQTALQTVLQNFVLGQLEREISRALGVDLFRLNTGSFFRGDFTQSLQDTRIEFGKYLSERLLITGSFDLRGAGYFTAEYQMDGLRLRFDTDLPLAQLFINQSFSPRPTFSLALALNPTLDLSFELGYPRSQQGLRVGAGLRWRF